MSREGSTDDNVVHVWFSIISSLMVCGLLTMALMMFWDGVRTTDGITYLNSNLKLLNWLCAMTGIFGMYVTLITWGIMANQVGRSDGHNQEARFPDQSSLVIVLIDLISIVVGATYVTLLNIVARITHYQYLGLILFFFYASTLLLIPGLIAMMRALHKAYSAISGNIIGRGRLQ